MNPIELMRRSLMLFVNGLAEIIGLLSSKSEHKALTVQIFKELKDSFKEMFGVTDADILKADGKDFWAVGLRMCDDDDSRPFFNKSNRLITGLRTQVEIRELIMKTLLDEGFSKFEFTDIHCVDIKGESQEEKIVLLKIQQARIESQVALDKAVKLFSYQLRLANLLPVRDKAKEAAFDQAVKAAVQELIVDVSIDEWPTIDDCFDYESDCSEDDYDGDDYDEDRNDYSDEDDDDDEDYTDHD